MVSTIKYKKNTGLPRFGGLKFNEEKDLKEKIYRQKIINMINYVIRNLR